MDLIIDKINKISDGYILCEIGSANNALSQLITELLEDKQLMTSITNNIGIMEKIAAAQERKDYLYLADLLQYELTPLLNHKPGR